MIGHQDGGAGMSKAEYSDEEMARIHVAPVKALNATIDLRPYDPAWPVMFEDEAAKIRGAIGKAAVAVHHAGSTSVPSLSAKPLIDIVLEVPASADEAAYVPALEAAGYRLHVREPEWFEHRLLKGTDPAVNMHVFTATCPEIDRMLAFRDWLRTHDDDRAVYQAAKQALAAKVWRHTQNYADAKSDVVEAIIAKAMASPFQP
jgi:GrpB-like predicted nucleotidyltransferase (UPF0157 family)